MLRPFSPRCFFTAFVAAWVMAVYLPSLVIAAAGLSPLAAGKSLPAATFAVADEVAPFAKIGFALLFGLLVFASRRLLRVRTAAAIAADAGAAIAAMLMVLAFLPSDWSRGFGVGLTGIRFAPGVTAIYVAGALVAGLAFSIVERRCIARYPATTR